MKKGLLLLLFVAGFSWNAMAGTNCKYTVNIVTVNATDVYINGTYSGVPVNVYLLKYSDHSQNPEIANGKLALAISAFNLGKKLNLYYEDSTHNCMIHHWDVFPTTIALSNS